MFIAEKITLSQLESLSQKMDGSIVKGVADIKKGVVVLDAPMHADEESFLLANGSDQSDLWGFNLFPSSYGTDDFIVYRSMINLRPWDGCRSMVITDTDVTRKIEELVDAIISDA